VRHRERGPAARVAVHLGEDDAGYGQAFGKRARHLHRILAGQTVQNEERLMRSDQGLDCPQLPHEGVIDMKSAGGVQDDEIEIPALGLFDPVPADGYRVLIATRIDLRPDRATHCFQLIDGGRPLYIRGDQQHAPPLGQKAASELTTEGRFPGTL